MIAELNELKWLLLPLYPVLLVVFIGLWLYLRAGKASKTQLEASMFGLKLKVSIDNTMSEHSAQSPHGGQHE